MTSLIKVYTRFPTPEAALAHLEHVRWGGRPICPYCGADTAARHNEAGRARWQCWSCRKSFSATVRTLFHNSHIDLQRWFLLISLMLRAREKKNLSATQAARDLQMRRATVWSMMERVRRALADDEELLSRLVELDEDDVTTEPTKRGGRDDIIESPRTRATKKKRMVEVERDGRA